MTNAGNYPQSLSVTDALAQSPNTAFVKLIESVGVTPTVDMAVRLGLRSYTLPGTAGQGTDQSLADYQKEANLGSFTLGPTYVNPLELSNVAATLASGGKWCPPNPIDSVFDRSGKQIPVTQQACEQVVEPGLANTLANAMSKDDQPGGTSASAASSVGWSLPMSGKTGTTESHRSSGFLGFTNRYAAAAYTYGDSPTPSEICSFPCARVVRATCSAVTSLHGPGTTRWIRWPRTSATSDSRPSTRSTCADRPTARFPTSRA